MGLGPSAHSFNGNSRQWNIANNPLYIKYISQNVSFYEVEKLTNKDKFNEYILTRFRTKWGLDKEYLIQMFPDFYQSIHPSLLKNLQSGNISETESHFYITENGKFIADHITSELFII